MPKSGQTGKTKTFSEGAPANYEAAINELESIVQQMESDTLSLEKSFACYKRGADLVKYCQQVLANMEAEVKILDNGVMQPFVTGADRVDE